VRCYQLVHSPVLISSGTIPFTQGESERTVLLWNDYAKPGTLLPAASLLLKINLLRERSFTGIFFL
jgi:hypothetical protein